MAYGLCHSPSLLLPRPQDPSRFKTTKSLALSKKQLEVVDAMYNSSEWAEKFMLMMELRSKIITFRHIIDLPSCDDSGPIHELVTRTLEDVQKLYPNVPCNLTDEMNETSVFQELVHFHDALKAIGDFWAKTYIWMPNASHRQNCSLENNADGSCENLSLEQLCVRVLEKLDEMINVATVTSDPMEEDVVNDKRIKNSTLRPAQNESYSDLKNACPSPVTPTSATPELKNMREYPDFSYSHTLLQPLRPQAVEKRHSLSSLMKENNEFQKENSISEEKPVMVTNGANTMPNIQKNPNSVQTPDLVALNLPLPALSNFTPDVKAPPVPPSIVPSKGSAAAPPPPMPLGKGAVPPPPPPLGETKALRPKKANTKLKRSNQMVNLYRLLKGKLEGSILRSKSFRGKKTQVGGSGAGKQSMSDALAEMTKRSAYFQHIEEDVQKHAKKITELQAAINSFETKDMAELLKFHKYVEQELEELTDESQVLARFEGFPAKKLETLRAAAALYLRLEEIVTKLVNWNIEPPLEQVLEKVEVYFDKMKREIDSLERRKDDDAKQFQSHKIDFDFQVLVRIKEAMVDVSSSCIELALKEQGALKAATNAESGPKNEAKRQKCTKMLWKAFQLAFRVYSFAGGQDDRANNLTKELAQEIETDPQPE